MKPLVQIPFGVFRPGHSLLHRLDPRVKLLGGATALLGAVLTQSWWGLALLAGLTGAALLSGDSKWREITRDLASLSLFYLITLLFHALFDRNGTPLWHVFGLTVTTSGIAAGFFFSFKIALLSLLAGVINRTTHPADWSRSAEALLPSHSRVARAFGRPALVFGLALRMLPTILLEAERIRLAQVARGLNPRRGGPVERMRNLLPLVGPLLASTLRRGDLLADAMQSRGFQLDSPRTSYRPLNMIFADWATLFLCIAITTGAIALR